MRCVLIVESDDRLLRERADQLLMDGYEVDAVSTSQAARIKLAERAGRAGALQRRHAGPSRSDCSASCAPARSRALTPRCRCSWSAPTTTPRRCATTAPAPTSRYPSRSSPLLVAAGLEALARRTAGEQERRRMLRVGSLTVDCDARVAQVDDRAVKLSRLEFDLLQTLASQPRKTFTRAELTREVWGYDPQAAGPSRTVDSHAHRLRHKLEQAGAEPMVQTVRGVGWRLTR